VRPLPRSTATSLTLLVLLVPLAACGGEPEQAPALTAPARASAGASTGAPAPAPTTQPPTPAPPAAPGTPAAAGAVLVTEPRLVDPAVAGQADLVVALGPDQVVAPPPAGTRASAEAALGFVGDVVTVVLVVDLPRGDVPVGAAVLRGVPGLDGPSVMDLGAPAPGAARGRVTWVAEAEVPPLAEAWRTGGLADFYVEVVTRRGPTGLVRGQLGP